MERSLTLGCLGLGIVGWACAFLLAQSRRKSGGVAVETAPFLARNPLFGAMALPFLVWILTLPTSSPFSAGQGFGRGFFLGGLASLAGAAVIFAASPRSGHKLSAAATAPLFAALAAVAVPLLWMRGTVIDALLGVALGWISVALLLLFALGETAANSGEIRDWLRLMLLNAAAFTTMLCAVAALGVYRDFVFPSVARGAYSAVALVLASSVALTLLGGALVGEMSADFGSSRSISWLPNAFSFLMALAVPLGLSALLGMKILDDLSLIYVVGAGAALGLALRWMLSHAASTGEVRSVLPFAVLVALCGFMLAYQLMQGFGVGLLLIAAWPASLLAWPVTVETASDAGESASSARGFEAAQILTSVLCFLAVLLMARLFATHYRGGLRGAGLSDQFALFGFVSGAMLPVLLASLGSKSLPRLLGAGALALILLGAMLSLWGLKIAPAFFVGLALSSAGWSFGFAQTQNLPLSALFSLAMSAALTQWAGRFESLAEVSRAARLHGLLWTLGGVIFLVLVVDYGGRLLAALRGRRSLIVAPSPGVSP